MDSEIQLVGDGEGFAVIGDPDAVERFLGAEGLPSSELGLPRLGPLLGTGAAAAEAVSTIAANSGRWVKLTEESARAVRKYGLRENAKTGLSTGVVRGQDGQIRGFVEFVKTPGSMLANPAVLAGVAGIMAQVAMQQAMDEITDYLAAIDEKVDDVLRAQTDAVLARMIGVGLVLEEAMTIREQRGRVDEVTWSKVQAAPATIAETQAYALRRLDALAEKLERRGLAELAEAAKEAEAKAGEWLAVLARCFQLQDALAVLELDRVLDASPAELDGHRRGLRAARQNRLELITRTTDGLLTRMAAAAGVANAKVLLNPSRAPGVVRSANRVTGAVAEFDQRLGIRRDPQSIEGRRWAEAAGEVRDRALETGAGGVDAARRLGGETFSRARSVTGSVSGRLTDRVRRPRPADRPDDE